MTLIHSVFSFQLSISAVHLFIGHFEKMATMATVGLRQIVRASQVVSSRGISVSAVVNKKDWSMYFSFVQILVDYVPLKIDFGGRFAVTLTQILLANFYVTNI